jgi:hypothetical protein
MEANKNILGFVVGLLVIFVFLIFWQNSKPEIKEVELKLGVGNVVGFNVDTNALDFGIVHEGSSSERSFSISNDTNRQKKIKIVVVGEIAQIVQISENQFWLDPGKGKEIKIKATAPKGSFGKTYAGKIVIYYI